MAFPNTAENYTEPGLSLDRLLIGHPSATYFVRVKGFALAQLGIINNSLAIVDRSLKPKAGDVIIALLDEEFLTRIYQPTKTGVYLKSLSPKYKTFNIGKEEDLEIWGVVIGCINMFRNHLEL